MKKVYEFVPKLEAIKELMRIIQVQGNKTANS
jgi:hypothetical protein